VTKLKEASVKHVLIDDSGNRGGYIYGGIALRISVAQFYFCPIALFTSTASLAQI
jgi:hypothetical protein